MIKNANHSGSLWFIFITILIDVVGWGIIIPIMPRLIEGLAHTNLSDASWLGGLLLFAYSVTQFIFAPIIGGLSDKYGRRPVLLASLFGFFVDYLFLAFAPGFIWLFLGRVIAGITGASITTASAYIADISPVEKRAQNFGLIGVSFGLGFIIGPAIGGISGQYLGIKAPFFIAAILSLLNFIYGYFFLPESLSQDKRRPFKWSRANPIGSLIQIKKYPEIIAFIVALGIVYLASHAVQSVWAYYTMLKFNWSESMVGYSLAVAGLLVALAQGGLIRVFISKFGANKTMIFSLIVSVITYFLFSIAWNSWIMFVLLIPFQIGGMCGPTLQGKISSGVPETEQGELQGLLTSMMSLTSIIGPLLMTGLFSYFTKDSSTVYFPGAPMVVASALFILSLLVVLYGIKKQDHIIKNIQ
ncbi:MAG: TCR/Tet family MFS transporter [Solitalea-like symbiont of Tyrophagus putrescentiae]